MVEILTRQNLLRDLAQQGQEGTVGHAMTCSYKVVDSNQMLEEVSQRLQVTECRALPAVHNGELVGLVTMENIGEFLMIRDALGGRGLRSTRI